MASPSSFFGIGIVSILLVLTKAKATVPIFVLGDSLADNGNNNNLNVPLLDKSNFAHNGIDFPGRIATGRFSNGFNGVDYIARFLGFPIGPPPYSTTTELNQMLRGVNFASAGSGIQDYTGPGTINMTTQIKNFQKVAQLLQQALGQNRAEHIIATSMFIIVHSTLDVSLQSWRKEFLYSWYRTSRLCTIPNKPKSRRDLHRHIEPAFYEVQHNCLSESESTEFTASRNEIYSYSNIYRMTSDIIENPILFGITDVQNACCGNGKFNGEVQCTTNVTYCHNRNDHFYWDWFHPTQAVYKITSQMAFFDSLIYSTPISIQQLVMGI
ncbi:GDSL esterase/lipase [Rhynchospora pubera]|uniref:GDSL esterase/lipase n=1 Tax=Rhynchospora pubera TaxID=906938 RepID=A0AAV8GB46_9POAL|nr:GDSL esterase/lipase [Rhynchospora pubera]